MDARLLVIGALPFIEVIVRKIWRCLLNEDANISGGLQMYIAEQELRELDEHMNYASFILAAGVANPKLIEDWISEARKIAFCLADQIAMYAEKPSNYQLYRMKSGIGMLSIRELTDRIKGKIPDAMRSSESMPHLPELSPFIRPPPVPQDGIYIMDDKIEKVEAFLEGALPVLFITGGQGSGKTTLMKYVYNRRKGDFDQCCWVDIAKTEGLVGLLKMVLEESDIPYDSINEFEIAKTVHDNFTDKNYLIVLDNVPDTYVLYFLKQVINDSKGKIICLTRRDIQKGENQDVLHIPGLKEYDSFMLLLSEAFPTFYRTSHLPRANLDKDSVLREAIAWKDHSSPSLLLTDLDANVTLLKDILSKCQNNPWNIWSIGTLLKSNPLDKWKEIGTQIDGMLINGAKIDEKRDPPIQLKDAKLAKATIRHCFLYCLAFPKTSEIPTRKLTRLWTAEGYVQDSPRQSQEQEAQRMLDKLIKKNLLVVKKKGFDGEVLKCSVNEHIRPLAEKMCKQQKFCRVVHDDGDEASSPRRMTKCFPISSNICIFGRKKTLSDRYRMLAVHGDRGVKEVSKALGKDIRLRSLLHFETGRPEHSELELSFQRTYVLLRTLELQGARLARLPSSIDCLVCLRYLGLRNTQLEYLPPTLENLRHLMCLDIRDTNIAEVADVSGFTEMRHLYLTKSFRSHSVLIRQGLRSLIHLQTLSGTACGDSSVRQSSRVVPFEKEITHLKRLRKLSIKKASRTCFENICNEIKGMDSLQSFAISCDRDGQPFDPSHLKIGKNLRKIKLGGPMDNKFCDLRSKMQSITYLYLWDSKLPVDVLRTLQGLKNLLLLSLLNASTEEKMSCDKGYHKLKKLSIIKMEKLSECEFGGNAMGNLEELVFAKCGNLKSSLPGLDRLAGSLREVHLTEMRTNFYKETNEKLKYEMYVSPDALSNVILKNPVHTSSGAATGGSDRRRGGTVAKEASKDSKKNALSFQTSAETIKKSRRLVYEAGEPLVLDDELQRLPAQMTLLHDTIMMRSRNRDDYVQHFKVEVPKDFGFFLDRHHDTFDINFEDIFNLFNLYRLDTMLVRLWALYQAQESRRLPNCAFGIIDPVVMNEYYVREAKPVLINFLTESLLYHKDKDYVLMPYNPPDHWILIVIHKPSRMIYYFDSQRSDKRDFSGIKEVLETAFSEYNLRGGGAESKCKKLIHKFSFPCRQQPENSVICGYYVCAHIDAFVISHNPQWSQDQFNNFIHDLADDKYDWRKDFARIQKTFAYVINNEVIRPSGDFYAGVQLPPSHRPASTSEAS